MKSAYLYVRVSTDEQKRKGYSLPEQEDRLLKYCENNDIEVKGIFSDDHSAKTFKRPAWEQLLVTIKADKAKQENNILFIKWDRFSRNIQNAYEMIGTLRKYNTTAMAIDQPIDLTVPESVVMFAVYLSVPEAENERRGLNTANGIRRAKQMGRYPHKAPLGYINLTGLDGRKYIAPQQPEADILKWAFHQIARDTHRVEDIRKMAHAKGLKCSRTNFWRLIRNPVYCGLVKLKIEATEQQLKGIHEPIIPEKLFEDVQNIINTKRRLSCQKNELNDLFPLKRYLTCPVCGRKLSGSCSTGRSKKYPYYHCTINSCKTRFKADELNEIYNEKLQRLVLSKKAVELFSLVLEDVNINICKTTYLNERKLLLKQIEEYDLFVSKARKLFIVNKLRYDDYREVKREYQINTGLLKNELNSVTNKLKNIDEQSKIADRSITHIFCGFTNLEIADKKYIINLIPPSRIDPFSRSFSLTLNQTLSKIIQTKDKSVDYQ